MCAVLLLLLAPAGRANSVVFATGVRKVGGFEENAQATFTITNNTITVELLNLEFNPQYLEQAIGSIRFTVSGNPMPTGLTFNGGTEIDINNGAPSIAKTQTALAWSWVAPSPGPGGQIALCAVCGTVGAHATDLIVGGPNKTTLHYDSLNSQFKNSSAEWMLGSGFTYTRNPLKKADAFPEWTFAFGSSLSNVTITSVTFGFGYSTDTAYGEEFYTMAPEPDSLILFATGLLLLGLAVGARYLRRH